MTHARTHTHKYTCIGSGVHRLLLNFGAKVEQHTVGGLGPAPLQAHLVQLAASVLVPLGCARAAVRPSSGPGAPCRSTEVVAEAARISVGCLAELSDMQRNFLFFSQHDFYVKLQYSYPILKLIRGNSTPFLYHL